MIIHHFACNIVLDSPPSGGKKGRGPCQPVHLLRPGGLRPWAPTGWRENVTTYELRGFLVRQLCDPGHPRDARENVTTCALRVFLVRRLCDPGHPRDARENVTMCALRVFLVRQLGTNDVRELHQLAPKCTLGGGGGGGPG